MAQRSTKQILNGAEETLATAKAGLEDVVGTRPERRLSGLRNLIVFGRAVTNVLQNLRTTESTFDEWYEPYVTEMRNDPLLKYLYECRSEILKEGKVRTGVKMHIESFSFPLDMAKFGPAPRNAKGFFMGDANGGTGWEVALGDGSIVKYYVAFPDDIGEIEVLLGGAPTEHVGGSLRDTRIETVCSAYYTYLAGVVASARARFGSLA